MLFSRHGLKMPMQRGTQLQCLDQQVEFKQIFI